MKHTILNAEIIHNREPSNNSIIFGAGCFWGVERKFWSLPGIVMTSVGYSGGDYDKPTYELVCTGSTGHAEVVKIDYDSQQISLLDLLKVFWECHDPTQGMRQGNDMGTQYRSTIYYKNDINKDKIYSSKEAYQKELYKNNLGIIETEIKKIDTYYYAEEYHQQYLAVEGSRQ